MKDISPALKGTLRKLSDEIVIEIAVTFWRNQFISTNNTNKSMKYIFLTSNCFKILTALKVRFNFCWDVENFIDGEAMYLVWHEPREKNIRFSINNAEFIKKLKLCLNSEVIELEKARRFSYEFRCNVRPSKLH